MPREQLLRRRHGRLGCSLMIFAATSCGTSAKNAPSGGGPAAVAPRADAQAGPLMTIDAAPPPNHEEVRTVSLSGKTPVPVPGSGLVVKISGSFHKIRAPLVGVSVLVSRGDDLAEVEWRIESGQIESEWRTISGRRWDADSSQHVEEEIPGWLVRLDSVDDSSAGGDPTAITISLRPAP